MGKKGNREGGGRKRKWGRRTGKREGEGRRGGKGWQWWEGAVMVVGE